MTICSVCNGVHDPIRHASWKNQKEAGMPFGIGKKQTTGPYNVRGRVASLGSVEVQDEEPAPVIVAGIGSAGLNRLAAYWKVSQEYGIEHRVSAIFGYDLNAANMRRWLPAMQEAGANNITVTPEFLPFGDGFLRRPDAWMQHQAAIHADLERMIDETRFAVSRAGSRAQLIVLFLGFGGHVRLGHVVQRLLAEAFPEVAMLPVVALPSEPALERNLRDYGLWDELISSIDQATPVLLSDNAFGDPPTIDAIAIEALASAELAAARDVSVRRLTELVAGHEQAGNRFLSVSQVSIPFPENAERGQRHRRAFFNRSAKPHEGASERASIAQTAAVLAEAIWRLTEPGPQSRTYTAEIAHNDSTDQEQTILLTLPFDAATTTLMDEQVNDLLRRDEFRDAFPNTIVAFGSGLAGQRHQAGQVRAKISKIYGSDATTPTAVEQIMDDIPRSAATTARAITRGQARRMAGTQAPSSIERIAPRTRLTR